MPEENIDAWRHFSARPLNEVLAEAASLREKHFGNKIELCSIISIRGGNCGMDCKFCAQSRHNAAKAPIYDLLPNGRLLEELENLSALPIRHIGLVASGAAMGGAEFDRLMNFLSAVSPALLQKICLSLGRLSRGQMLALKKLGIRRLHHNLETSKQFYPQICSSQKWEDRHKTAMTALECGLELCSGFLFGLGETWDDRIAFALELKKAGITNIPMNFLDPAPGTPMESRKPLGMEETLRIIALYRHILPHATLRVCGGRLKSLGNKQEMMFAAGANALMTGNFLTTKGNATKADLEMLEKMVLIAV